MPEVGRCRERVQACCFQLLDERYKVYFSAFVTALSAFLQFVKPILDRLDDSANEVLPAILKFACCWLLALCYIALEGVCHLWDGGLPLRSSEIGRLSINSGPGLIRRASSAVALCNSWLLETLETQPQETNS